MTLLRNAGADISLIDAYDNTALMLAAQSGHTELALTLLTNDWDNYSDSQAVVMSAQFGHTETYMAFINAGADVNQIEYGHMTALMLAAEAGHAEMVQAILNIENVDVYLENLQDETALMLAAKEGNAEVMKVFLNAEIFDVASDGHELLLMAADSNNQGVVDFLLLEAVNPDLLPDEYDRKEQLIARRASLLSDLHLEVPILSQGMLQVSTSNQENINYLPILDRDNESLNNIASFLENSDSKLGKYIIKKDNQLVEDLVNARKTKEGRELESDNNENISDVDYFCDLDQNELVDDIKDPSPDTSPRDDQSPLSKRSKGNKER